MRIGLAVVATAAFLVIPTIADGAPGKGKKPPTKTPQPTSTPAPTNTPQPTSTPAPTNTPQPTSTPAPPTATPPPPTATSDVPSPTPDPDGGIWISAAEVQALPASGPAWNNVLAYANASLGTPTLCDQDSTTNVKVLAKGLVYARTTDESYRTAARQAIMAIIGTEDGSSCRSLAIGRKLAAYVIAADLVGLSSAEDATFRAWLADVRTEVMADDNRSLVDCHVERPNNWGTMCGASRAAASAYLGDTADLDQTATVFRGYLGDRTAYAGFNYGSDLSWHLDSGAPRGVNPAGAVKQSTDIDGVLPDDMRRGGAFTTGCPVETNYPWEALQGATVQAELLHRQGYDAWGWEASALRRAVRYLHDLDARCGAWYDEAITGDDRFVPWLVNHASGSSFPTTSPVAHGKVMSFTDWTHDPATRPR